MSNNLRTPSGVSSTAPASIHCAMVLISMSLSGGRPEFTNGVKPTRFHEMAPATVPAAYLRAFARVADLAAPPGVVWGVRLPPQIESSVRNLTRAAKGGCW